VCFFGFYFPPRYAPRKKFMKLKDFQTPFEQPPALMELLVLPDEPLPVLCVGATRDKSSRYEQALNEQKRN
jgi:hypothetical protein